MQTRRPLFAVLSVVVLGGVVVTHAADLGTTNIVPADQIKKKVAPATSSPTAPNTGKALNTSPGNEQVLRNAAQPNVPASGASPANIPQTGIQPQQLPEADMSGMRRTDGSSPPPGPFGSINDHRPPIYPDARDALNTSPRNEQILRDANRPDLPGGAFPGLSLPGSPATIPGESTGTTSRENKASAGGTSGLRNSSALGSTNATGLSSGAGAVGGAGLLQKELMGETVRVLDPEVAKALEEIRPLEDAKLADPLGGANPSEDPWKRPLSPTPNTEPGTAAAKAGLIESPQGKASDGAPENEIGPSRERPNEVRVTREDGTTIDHFRNSDGSSTTHTYGPDGWTTHYHDAEGKHTGSDLPDRSHIGPDRSHDIVQYTSAGIPVSRDTVTRQAREDGKRPMPGSTPSSQPNENEPQNVGWRGLAPARSAQATNEPRGPLVSPVDPDDAIVRIQEEGRRSPAEMKAMVTRPSEGSESGGGDGSGKRDPCRLAQPGPGGQLPEGCGGGGGAPR